MQAPAGQMTAPALRALLKDGVLAGDWVLDPRRSSIRLKSRIMGLAPVNGVFRDVSGHGTVSPDGEVSCTLTVAAASIDTNNTRRDPHLRSADFFDTLTVRDRTRPLSFDAAASVPGNGEIWLDAEVRINRADFGLIWNPLSGPRMHNTLTIHAVFTRR